MYKAPIFIFMSGYKLYMTEYEICMAYKYALNRRKQVRILSDLNASCIGAILIVLDYNGYNTYKYWGEDILKKAREELDDIILKDLNNGLKYGAIAKKLGYSYGYIAGRGSALRKKGLVGNGDYLDNENNDHLDDNVDKFKNQENNTSNSVINEQDTQNLRDKQLLYYNTYKRIENILKLRDDNDSDEVKQAFSELAVKILRSTIEEV